MWTEQKQSTPMYTNWMNKKEEEGDGDEEKWNTADKIEQNKQELRIPISRYIFHVYMRHININRFDKVGLILTISYQINGRSTIKEDSENLLQNFWSQFKSNAIYQDTQNIRSTQMNTKKYTQNACHKQKTSTKSGRINSEIFQTKLLGKWSANNPIKILQKSPYEENNKRTSSLYHNYIKVFVI